MRIHLILRSMWPKRAHVEDVHVGLVELMGLGDEVCPVIPRIEGLLRGVATEMRVSCCLFSTRTPVLHRICFGADLTRRKRRAGRSNTLPRQLTRLLRAARTLLFGFTWSIQRPCPSCRSATKRIEPFGRTEFFRRLSSWAMTASARARVTAIRPRVEPINILSDASVQLSLQPLPEPSKSRKSLRISHSEINKKCFSLSVVKGLARSANLPPLESKGREPPRGCLVHQRNRRAGGPSLSLIHI